jgi:heme oxygenase
MPVVKEYMDHIMSISQDPDKLMAHIYVRHMGDLSGGQMIAKKVPGAGTMYQFDEDVNVLKERIREKLDDSMAEEAKIAFDFATKLFKQLTEESKKAMF